MLNISFYVIANEMDEENNKESFQDKNLKDQDYFDEGEIGVVGGVDYSGISQNVQVE